MGRIPRFVRVLRFVRFSHVVNFVRLRRVMYFCALLAHGENPLHAFVPGSG